MKNVTKILGAVVLCTALFASAQRTDALGGNQFWPEDEANIAWFPAQVNNHAYVQLSGIGTTDVGTADEATDAGHASILFQKDGTTWGFNYGGADWINMHWGDGQQGVSFGLQNDETSAGVATSNYSIGYGNTFSDFLGSFLGTFAGVIIKNITGVTDTPIWSDTIGIVIGCLLGIYIPSAITGKK